MTRFAIINVTVPNRMEQNVIMLLSTKLISEYTSVPFTTRFANARNDPEMKISTRQFPIYPNK
jgi:hypothetical protein